MTSPLKSLCNLVTCSKPAVRWVFSLALVGTTATRIPWEDLTERDWLYALATRFSLVEGHQVHYPTPTAELARLLESRSEVAALRHLAEARLELGDRKGALAAMERWSTAQGAEAWAETARWCYAHLEVPAAFQAAERALPGLAAEAKRALADERIRWADRFPEHADRIALRQARAEAFPKDAAVLEDWLRALEKANRLDEADRALAASRALSPERSLLLRSDLLADHKNHRGALQVLDAAISQPWSIDVRRAFTQRVNSALPSAPGSWRAVLEQAYEPGALVRLATYFQGQGRGDAVVDLLRQIERRYEATFNRDARLLVARLYQEVDAVPEAFRSTLAAAQLGSAEEQKGDLAVLARLALRAGSRPLALGTYNDEAYHWAARMDRTPGFWTGGMSFLLTGLDWKEAMGRLESESLPQRTFALARSLTDELAKREPGHRELPTLRVALMQRHVERGEGKAALALLPMLEAGPAASADEGRRVALLAMRQVTLPIPEEVRLMQARLRHLAADGSQPARGTRGDGGEDEPASDEAPEPRPWARPSKGTQPPNYTDLLNECLSRLEHRDPSHQTSLGLVLGELDRLPTAEELWLGLATRLEGWNLDDELGPRFEQALQRFKGPGIWERAARWHARRNHHAELRRLAEAIAQRFRGADLFARSDGASTIRMEIPEQPQIGGRVRLVPWADWVRLKALERFPHSPRVFHEAQRLMTESRWQASTKPEKTYKDASGPVVVADALISERRWAVLFIDPVERERFFAEAMRQGTLESRLTALEGNGTRTPVDELILFEGWSRLSRFERAVAGADRLASSYPGEGSLARRVLSLHRSLNGLDAAHSGPARALVVRVAPALEDPTPLWTELGELEEERGHPEAAAAVWRSIVDRDPRNPARLSELATLLWDYGHDGEALAVVEAGRKRLERPRFFAFETGVLRENLKDIDGAVREYLDALRPEQGAGYLSAFEQDQRSLRRLAQLLGRTRIFSTVERRIKGLKPGDAEDERTLAAFFPLATIEAPAPGLSWDADLWIDEMDQPNDPLGRAQRSDRQGQTRPAQYNGIAKIGDVLLEKALEMAPRASASEFLAATQTWSSELIEKRWPKDRSVAFRNTLMARTAELAADDGVRIRLEIARARFLAENGWAAAADAVWTALDPRIGTLPEGSARLRAEAERAGYLERAKGLPTAAAEWKRLTARYPWSLGLLEDRLAFLQRAGMGEEARKVLEEVAPRAASGHREALLERLTKDSLAAADLSRARKAVEQWLGESSLEGARRLGGIHLLARLSYKENPGWNAFPLAKAEAAKLQEPEHADLWQQLARAADLESAAALPLWIEALNRRTEREWLVTASRSAERTGKGEELLAYFEQQRQRSPRDVRWAVAVRDIKRAFHQVEGALEAAKAAVAVRPEREILWREAVELLVRADRVKEAADYLEGWNRPRPADEGVAKWRSELYARGGDGDRALAIERAALEAFRRSAPADREGLAERKSRAVLRLLENGLPNLALRLYSAAGDILGLSGSTIPADKQCELALLTGQFPRLLVRNSSDSDFLSAAASTLRYRGRPEHRDEVQAFLLGQFLPAGATQPDSNAIAKWWPFADQAGLETQLRFGLANGMLARRPGPWQSHPPLPFVEAAGMEIVSSSPASNGSPLWLYREPDWARLWVRELARWDRGADLLAFLEPRWQDLLAQVKGSRNLDVSSERLPWTVWFDDPAVLLVWSRAAEGRPEKVKELGEVLAERRLWDRFWVLAARKWQPTPLVLLAPQSARTAWFAFWDPQQSSDPLLASRRRTVEDATLALGRLIQGTPGSAEDPLIDKLRGPQRIGEILGRNARWVWSEFALRRDAKGDLLEQGDDRMIGTGADQGRLPGALWGVRPGEAWYVLETLARYRKKEESALYVPLEVPQRGGETDRLLLAMHLARVLGKPTLALELDASHPAAPADRRRLETKLLQWVAAGQKPQALETWRDFLRRSQGKLSEAEFRWHASLAEEQGLPSPFELLDAQRPVSPAFLAYLYDQKMDRAATFRTEDPTGFRLALLNRWRNRQAELSADQARFWLKELWATGSAPFPLLGISKVGGIWPQAAEWLDRRPVAERKGALEAIEEAVNPAIPQPNRFPWPSKSGGEETVRLLALRLRLHRGEQPQALALLDGMLEECRQAETLGLPASAPDSEPPAREEGGEGTEDEPGFAAPPSFPSAGDPLVDRLQAWLKPFRNAKQAERVEERFRTLLRQRRTQGTVSAAAWRLAFQLSPTAELAGLSAELGKAWFRGDIQPEQLGTILESLASVLPQEVPRWLARWPRTQGYNQAGQRAAILAKAKMGTAALAVLVDSRRRSLWRAEEEVQAFDQWRRLGAPAGAEAKPPASWVGALPFWGGKAAPGLGDRLQAHPNDVLSSRSAYRHPGPLDEATVLRVNLAQSAQRPSTGDRLLLKLKAARWMFAASWRAANTALGSNPPEEYRRLLVERRMKSADINAALTDLAHIASKDGNETRVKALLGLLGERKATNLKPLHAELALDNPAKPEAYRMVEGRPAPLRPRDLTWSLLAQVLKAEGVR
jgi:hypothetical protein